MKDDRAFFTKLVFFSSIFSAISILYISVVLPFYKVQIFLHREIITPVESFMLAGFFFILFFIISSILWQLIDYRRREKSVPGTYFRLILGLFCFVFIMGEKVLADEIGREMQLGWETTGELIILNILLALQFIYSVIMFIKLMPNHAG